MAERQSALLHTSHGELNVLAKSVRGGDPGTYFRSLGNGYLTWVPISAPTTSKSQEQEQKNQEQ